MTATAKRGIRVRKDKAAWNAKGWTSVPNAILDSGGEIGEGAVAAFCWMARHNDTFEFTAADVAKAFGAGLHRAEDWLYALEFGGWLTRHYDRNHLGRITGVEYVLHPEPVAQEDRTARERKTRKKRSTLPAKLSTTSRSGLKSARAEDSDAAAPTVPEKPSSEPTSVHAEVGAPSSVRPYYGCAEREEHKTKGEDQHHGPTPEPHDDDVESFWDNLADTVSVDPPGRRTVAVQVRDALAGPWTPQELSSWLTGQISRANGSVRNRAGFAVTQLRDIPPAPPAAAAPGLGRFVFELPEWCGKCDPLGEHEPLDRYLLKPDGTPGRMCDDCHPAPARARQLAAAEGQGNNQPRAGQAHP